ncbi:MAG TPA: aminoglycoside adenylyltransferase domain-containing protein, partial [Anaerolineales bacterium]|nr:aminoglycoside adenylyltransferase domain-containing protein [Anaerolineales bacterium]
EVSYIPKDALRRFDPTNNKHPHLGRGTDEKLQIIAQGSDWVIERHITRERGITVIGPDPKTLIDPVSPNDLRNAVAEGMPIWLNPIIENPVKMSTRSYQSFVVLSLCRMLYTLLYGEIISKSMAAEWALENLPSKWKPLIERAWVGRQNSNLDAQPEDIIGTVDMMRFTLQQIKPTPYSEVNEILNLLLTSVQGILKNQFVGMYLYGSLSTGDFNPETSDLDFLVVTTSTLSNKTIAELEAMHRRIWESGSPWASRLEGSYLPKREIRRHDPLSQPCPTVNEGTFFLDKRGSDWIIQRHVIREQGVILAGPDPKTLIDPVDPKNIRRAVKGVLNEWWFPMIEDPTWLREHGSEYHAYAILTMCRALYTLENGTIVSKPTAARWVQGKLGENWSQVIEQAIDAQKHGAEHAGLFNNALQLIRITKEMATS